MRELIPFINLLCYCCSNVCCNITSKLVYLVGHRHGEKWPFIIFLSNWQRLPKLQPYKTNGPSLKHEKPQHWTECSNKFGKQVFYTELIIYNIYYLRQHILSMSIKHTGCRTIPMKPLHLLCTNESTSWHTVADL